MPPLACFEVDKNLIAPVILKETWRQRDLFSVTPRYTWLLTELCVWSSKEISECAFVFLHLRISNCSALHGIQKERTRNKTRSYRD